MVRCSMKISDLALISHKNLWRRKGRAILTVLGVIIGTTSIVVMLSLGIGLVESQKESIAQWGSLNIIHVNQAMDYPFPVEDEEEFPQQKRLTDEAIAEIRAMEGVVGVSPAFDVSGEVTWGKRIGYINLVGIEPEMMELLDFEAQGGRLLNAGDRFNVVVGAQVVNNFHEDTGHFRPPEYMEERDPLELLNQRLKLTIFNAQQQKRIYSLNVVGVLSEKNMDRAWEVYGPISEVRRMRDFMLQGTQGQGQFDGIIGEPIFEGELEIEGAIRGGSPRSKRAKPEEEQYAYALVATRDVADTRRLSNELRDLGYNAWSMADSLEGIEQIARRMQAVLGGIGAVALLVAAIGITNTMVMSIYERTREIAVMKVIGASFGDIRWLFLAESSLIGLLGGALGIGLSYLLSNLLNRYGVAFMNPGMPVEEAGMMQISQIPLWLVGFALLFSMGIGLLAGIYPANRAIRLDPIEAMRHL